MPKYKLKNGKYVIVQPKDMKLFLASDDAKDAELIGEKKELDSVKKTAVVGSGNQAVDTGSSLEDSSLDSPIRGKTKQGELLTRQELFFKNKAKPSRYADAFIDPEFDAEDITKKQKEALDKVQNIADDYLDLDLTPKGGRGIDKSWAITPWTDYIQGRDFEELSEDPAFEEEVRNRILDKYSEDNPNGFEPDGAAVDSLVREAISLKREEVRSNKKYENLKRADYLKANDQYLPFLNKGAKGMIDDMELPEQALSKANQEIKALNNSLKKLNKYSPEYATTLEKIEGIKKQIPSLTAEIDKNYKPFLNLQTNKRITAEEAEKVKNSGGDVEDLSEKDARLLQYYKSLTGEKLDQAFFEHLLLKENTEDILNQKITSVKPLAADSPLGQRYARKGYTQNEDGTWTVALKDAPYGMGAFDNDFIGEQLNFYKKDKEKIAKEGEALKTAYFLNVDPASVEEDFGDVLLRGGEVLVEAVAGKDAYALGTSKRKELDELENLLLESDIKLTDKEKEAFERSFSYKAYEQGIGFIPELVKFAGINKAAGAAGITARIAKLMKPMAGLTASQNARRKALGITLDVLLEEAKFKIVTKGESQTGGGAGFKIGGMLFGKAIPFRLQGRAAAFNPFLEKAVLGGVGGATGSEAALLAESLYKEVKGSKAWQTSIKDEYGDLGEVGERMLLNSIVFGMTGVAGMTNKSDWLSMPAKRRYQTELENKLKETGLSKSEITKLENKLDLVDRDIAISEKGFMSQNIGSMQEQKRLAEEIIATGEVPQFISPKGTYEKVPATPADIKNAKEVVAKVQAATAAAQRQISKQFDNIMRSGIVPENKNISLEITDQPLLNGDKATYDRAQGKFTVDINSYKPGVFGQETGHFFMNLAFDNNPAAAKIFKDKIVNEVNTKFKDLRFTVDGKENLTFEQAIDAAYGKTVRAEEYVMNIVEFLNNPKYRDMLIDSGLLGSLKDNVISMGNKIGLNYNPKQNFTTAQQLLKFLDDLGTVAEGGSSRDIKRKFDAFKNIVIDGKKLIDLNTGNEIVSNAKAENALKSVKIEESTKKDVFSKAEKMYEEYKDNMSNAGLMVGMEFEPIVRKMTNKYRDLYGMDQATMDNIVTDVMIETRPGYNGIPDLVKTWNPSKGASLTSHIYGNLPNRILGIIQRKYPDLGKTVRIENEKAEKITTEESFDGGGFVDISSPETYTRVSQKKAEATMGMSEAYSKKAAEVGERILMTTKLQDLDAKSVGTIKSAEGETLRVAMLEGNKARVTKPDGTTEIIPARSPKVVEQKYGAPEKSFRKVPTTKDQMVADAKDFLIPEMEKEAGGLQDNYTPTPKYESFIDRTFPLFKDYISQSAVNKRFADLKQPVIDPVTGKQKREKTAVGKAIFTKKNITLAEWRKYFIGDGKMRIDGRRRSLLEALATEQGFDKVMETLGNEALRKQIESRQEDLSVDLIDNYVAVMAKSLDRNNPTVMSSRDIKEISKRSGKSEAYIKNELINAIFIGNDNVLERLPADIKDHAIAVVIKSLNELYYNKIITGFENPVTDYTKDKLQKIGVTNNFNPKKIAGFQSQNKQQVENSLAVAKELTSFFPDFTKDLTKSSESNLEYTLISNLVNFTGRRSFKAKVQTTRDLKTAKVTKPDVEMVGFKQLAGESYGSKFNELSKDLQDAWNRWNKSLPSKSLGYATASFEKAVRRLADRTDLTIEQKQVELNNLPGLKEAKRDNAAKVEFLKLVLRTMGEISKNYEGKKLNDFAYGISTMLLNNDGTGIRNYSSLSYIDLSPGQGKRSNEHLRSKAEFGALVLDAILKGDLTAAKAEQLTKKYVSEISSAEAQKISDVFLGVTNQTGAYTKMAAESIVDYSLGTFNIQSLNNKYNWTTGQTALQELYDIKAKEMSRELIKADKLITSKGWDVFGMSDVVARDLYNKDFKNLTEAQKSKVQNKMVVNRMVQTTTLMASKAIELDNAIKKAKDPNKTRKGISVFDFDDTLAKTKSNVLYTMPDGKRGKLNAEQFAKRGEELSSKGAEFDFSEFNKVVKAELGPLFTEAQKKAGKFTTKDIFVLTARPPQSAAAIHKYLKSQGLDIPIDNITGLGDSRAEAKAEWMIGKVAKGYNDFYFADDAIKNVKAVKQALDLFDVKSDVQQAIMASKDIKLDQELANMIERKKGISATEPMSAALAANIGRKKGKFDFFLPPNAEDFAGLMYKLYGKGKQGNADMALISEKLLKPYNRGEQAISTYKQNLAEDYKSIEKQLGDIEGTVTAETKADLKELNFNADQAVRVALWNQAGIEVPGITNLEAAKLRRIVLKDPRLRAYADGVKAIIKGDIFEPGETWFSSNIRYDLFKHATEGVRGKFLEEWQTNMDAMFTPENFNRMEAAYGTDYVRNLKDMIDRMKTGRTRSKNIGKEANAALDYINGSVGVIMWVNTRSAMLQTISAINYLNWTDNNPLAVAKTLTKPKEFAKTFVEIFNSDFLKQRRSGLEINVEEAEIAKAVEKSRGKARYLFDALIKMGFKPTQIADSFAIAAGGTPFYMNRTGTYVRKGFELAEAKKKAFEDLRELSEENQQSSRMDRVSNIQTGLLGRLVFAFNNTPFQMTRLQKKAALDLINQRGDWKTNVSKMVYYSTIQSLIFYALQQGTALTLFGKDDENLTPEQKEKIEKYKNKKVTNMANSMLDSFLAGSGLPGKILVTGKNTLAKYAAESKKGYQADYGNVINEALSISPPLSSKTKKAYSAFKQFKFGSTKKGQAELAKYGEFDALNPTNIARAKIFSAVTNVPVDRMLKKIENLDAAYNTENLSPQIQLALILGWDKWSLGFYDGLYGDDAEEVLLSPEEEKENKSKNLSKARQKTIEEKRNKYWNLSRRERDSLRFVEMQKKYKK